MPHTDTETLKDKQDNEKTNEQELPKIPPVVQKVSRFGPAGFQGGSKFGKGPANNANPASKQRVGRGAARGR